MMNRTEILKEFSAAKNAAELKKIYFKLLKENHPDKGGDTATCQAINDIYKELADRAILGEFKPFGTAVDEKEIKIEDVSAEMFAAIMAVINLVDLELCGRWLWATGNTYAARESLKAAGYRWAPKKQAWYWHSAEESSRRSRGKYTLDEIRAAYGSSKFETPELLSA